MGNKQSAQYSFQDDFNLLQDSNPRNGFYRLQSKQSSQVFVGKQLQSNDKDDIFEIQCIVEQKIKNPSPFVTKLIDSKKGTSQTYCSTIHNIYLLFRQPSKTLHQEFIDRSQANEPFHPQHVDTVINRCSKGLKYLYDINHNHCKVSLKSVTWPLDSSESVQLIDQWALNDSAIETKTRVYRPKNIMDQEQKNEEQYQDLFRLGMVAQEMVNLRNYNELVKNKNLYPISQKIQRKIYVLTSANPQSRMAIYDMVNEQGQLQNLKFETAKTANSHFLPPENKKNEYAVHQTPVQMTVHNAPHYPPLPRPISYNIALSQPPQTISNANLKPLPSISQQQTQLNFLTPPPFSATQNYSIDQIRQQKTVFTETFINTNKTQFSIGPPKVNFNNSSSAQFSKPVYPIQSKPSTFSSGKPFIPLKQEKNSPYLPLLETNSAFNTPPLDPYSKPANFSSMSFNFLSDQQKANNHYSQPSSTNFGVPQKKFDSNFQMNVPGPTVLPPLPNSNDTSIFTSSDFFNKIGTSSSYTNSNYFESSKNEAISGNLSPFNHDVYQPAYNNFGPKFETNAVSYTNNLGLANTLNNINTQNVGAQLGVEKFSSTNADDMKENEVKSSLKSEQNYIEQNSNKDVSDERDYVIEEYENGSRYEGFKRRGMRNGQGKFYYQEGSYYDGEWKDNNMDGYGKLYYPSGKLAYEGEWSMDEFNGKGKVYNDVPVAIEGSFDYTNFEQLKEQWRYYEGSLVSDSKEGFGKLVLSNGQYYEGEFKGDRINGKGKFVTNTGEIIIGIWQDSVLIKTL